MSALTMQSWNHSQSSVVTVTFCTLRRAGSILPISLYSASLNGSAVEEWSMCALNAACTWSRCGFGSLQDVRKAPFNQGIGRSRTFGRATRSRRGSG